MLTSQYLAMLTKKAISLENGTMPDDEIPNTYLLLRHHNLTDLSFLQTADSFLNTNI